ncbi:Exonuclease 3'-5' domain-containing protein [Aureococcus anophagefferens]|nr:Exonuclease 3'-5' domain-containing protein [Aureococcus anophagefferens]
MRASTVCTMAVGTPAAAEKKAATDKENDDALLAVATLTRTPILITDHVEADAAVTEIVTALQQPGARKVIAVDCEWIGEQKLGADVVQIAASTGPLYVFHVARMRHFPRGLKQLLADEAFAKVGCCLWVDRGRLKHNGAPLSPIVELAHLARDRGIIKGSRASSRARGVLRRRLPKGPAQSNWKQALDADQLAYAALDVEVTVAIHAALIAASARGARTAELAAATARNRGKVPT